MHFNVFYNRVASVKRENITAKEVVNPMRIDAHQHYWRITRGDYGWITPELKRLYRDFLPDDLEPLLSKHKLDGSILVQAAPTLEETMCILSIAAEQPSVLGVVGWLDLFDPNHRSHYEQCCTHSKYVGFRIMIQDMKDSTCILEPRFIEALREYAALKVPIDLLVSSHQLEDVIAMLKQVPTLRGVIDHIGKPPIKEGLLEPWASHLSEISRFPNIYCKLSGMVTEADHAAWKAMDFIPYIRHVLQEFGSSRVMYGSDWPVCLLAGDYDEVMDILTAALPSKWSGAERLRLFGLNAKEFYKL